MLTISQAAAQMGVSAPTLRRWDRCGILTPFRTAGNHRRYSLASIRAFLGRCREIKNDESARPERKDESEQAVRKAAVYARVSQPIQRQHGDLDRQVDRLKKVASKRGYKVSSTYTDVASGLNDKRRGLRRMFKDAAGGKFSRVFITYPDRLSRFCVAYLERHLAAFNVDLFYTDKHDKDTPQAELVSDMMAIIASFSGRLHGLRAKKNRLRDEKKIPGVLKKLKRLAELLPGALTTDRLKYHSCVFIINL